MTRRGTYTYGAAARPRRRGSVWVVGAVAVAAIAAVIAIAGSNDHDKPPVASRPTSGQPLATREAAVRAAVDAFYRLALPAFLNRRAFEHSVVELAAPRSASRVRAAFGESEPSLLAAFADEPRTLRGAPLGYRVDSHTARAASVAIWNVAIAGTRRYGVQTQWRTVVIDLAWTSGGWKVTGGSGDGGPDPSMSPEQLAASASSFTPLSHVP